jgi:peroxiredoxin
MRRFLVALMTHTIASSSRSSPVDASAASQVLDFNEASVMRRQKRRPVGMSTMVKISAISKAEADAAELAMASASCAVTHALHAGARAPLFVLTSKQGNKVALDRLLRAGPVVLNFFRGSWCSFGEESFEQFSAVHQRILLTGANAVAIAPPEIPGREPSQLSIPELVDVELRIARAYGLTFNLSENLRSRYLDLGYTPPKAQKSGDFLVPVPATYLIDEDGTVVFASVDFDYRNGFDGESLLKAVRALRAHRALINHGGIRVVSTKPQLRRNMRRKPQAISASTVYK